MLSVESQQGSETVGLCAQTRVAILLHIRTCDVDGYLIG